MIGLTDRRTKEERAQAVWKARPRPAGSLSPARHSEVVRRVSALDTTARTHVWFNGTVVLVWGIRPGHRVCPSTATELAAWVERAMGETHELAMVRIGSEAVVVELAMKEHKAC